MTDAARLDTRDDRSRFIFGGKAVFTVVSTGTGTRFTFKVKSSDDGAMSFVSVLNGPDNWENYLYIGFVPRPPHVKLVAGRRGRPDAPSFKALSWVLRNLDSDKVEVWTEGKCCRCNRRLTDPVSIARGIGPECAKHFDIVSA